MNELKTEIMLSEKKKVQIIENAHQIAKQRKKAIKIALLQCCFFIAYHWNNRIFCEWALRDNG